MTLGLVVRNNKEAVLLSDTMTTWEYENIIATTKQGMKKYFDYESKNLTFRFVNAGNADESEELFASLKRVNPSSNDEALDVIRIVMHALLDREADRGNERGRHIWEKSSQLIFDNEKRAAYRHEKELESAGNDVKARIPFNTYLYAGKDSDGVRAYYFLNGDYNFISSSAYGIGTGGRAAETFLFPITKPIEDLTRTDLLATAFLGLARATTIPTVGGAPDVILIGDDVLKLDRQITAVLANYAGARLTERVSKKEYARAINAGLEGDMEKTLQNLERLGESRQSMIDYAQPFSYWIARAR